MSDALWAVVEPLLRTEPPKPKGGRPRLSNRKVLTGIADQFGTWVKLALACAAREALRMGDLVEAMLRDAFDVRLRED